MATPGFVPGPASEGTPVVSPPCQLLFAAPVWNSWQFTFVGYSPEELRRHAQDPKSGMARIIAGKKLITKPDSNNAWGTNKHFAYLNGVHSCITTYKDGSKQKNLFGIEEFLQTEEIAIVASTPALCSSVDFVDTLHTMNEISEAQAFHNSLLENFDESAKPVRVRVGKRAGGLPPMPQTAQASRTSAPGGSSNNVSH